jgi:hypothetical protein
MLNRTEGEYHIVHRSRVLFASGLRNTSKLLTDCEARCALKQEALAYNGGSTSC